MTGRPRSEWRDRVVDVAGCRRTSMPLPSSWPTPPSGCCRPRPRRTSRGVR